MSKCEIKNKAQSQDKLAEDTVQLPEARSSVQPLTGDRDYSREDLEKYVRSLSLQELAAHTTGYIFRSKLDNKSEDLALYHVLEDTDYVQCELYEKVSQVFTNQSYTPPDTIMLVVLRRKAGFNQKNFCQKYKDDVGQNVNRMGEYVCIINCKEVQVIRHGKTTYTLDEWDSNGIVNQKEDLVIIPKNVTKIPKKNRCTLKKREYLSITLWCFWDTSPTNKSKSKENPVQCLTQDKLLKELSNKFDEDCNKINYVENNLGLLIDNL